MRSRARGFLSSCHRVVYFRVLKRRQLGQLRYLSYPSRGSTYIYIYVYIYIYYRSPPNSLRRATPAPESFSKFWVIFHRSTFRFDRRFSHVSSFPLPPRQSIALTPLGHRTRSHTGGTEDDVILRAVRRRQAIRCGKVGVLLEYPGHVKVLLHTTTLISSTSTRQNRASLRIRA